jgi:tyrosyl-tRNA synthetase
MTLSEELQWRGFVNQTTFAVITDLDKNTRTLYFGVDPSADSMTIGNLASALMVRHFIDHGYKAVLLVGGATGMIGDPDGKAEERDLLSLEDLTRNKAAIAAQYKQVFAGQDFELVDNFDWFQRIGYLEFLRDIGKHVPMRQMLGREFVQSRLKEDGAGISYAEFSYALIQAYDFLYLYKNKQVTLQLCGADQWGNSVAGVDLIRRTTGGEAHVWSSPLIINKTTGKKFGKTEDGAVWLDEKKTSVYKFYQFWLNSDDEGVEDYLKVYTLLNKAEIAEAVNRFKERPSERYAQKLLAYEVTKIVHGKERAEAVRRVSETLFGSGDYKNLSTEDFDLLSNELPVVRAKQDDTTLVAALVEASLASSNSEARRLLESGAVYINGEQLPLNKVLFGKEDDVQGHAILRVGKNKNSLIKF